MDDSPSYGTVRSSAKLFSPVEGFEHIELGAVGGELVFTPNQLNFETGKLYKLIRKNPRKDKHSFSASRFVAAVWTRKVETQSSEIKGAVRAIELKPGGAAEWFSCQCRRVAFISSTAFQVISMAAWWARLRFNRYQSR